MILFITPARRDESDYISSEPNEKDSDNA